MTDIKKGIIQVFIANFVFLIISLVINLLLPKYLTFESYAYLKTYALYISYAGFFHFGYNDGMYLKYGGKTLEEINSCDFGKNYYNYVLLESFVAAIIFIFGLIILDIVVIAFAFGMLATNIIGYFKSFYQSIGEFKLYGRTLNIEKLFLMILYVILIFAVKTDNSAFFIWIQIVIQSLIAVFLMFYLNSKYKFVDQLHLSISEIVSNIKKGFILMLGNFANGLFTGIDRWFIKILMTTSPFAIYSFAVSMENMINVFVTPISITMYNNFAKNHKIEYILSIKKVVLLWGPLIVATAFPCKWILEHYLTQYIEASNLIFLLFSTQIFYVVIKGIYVNYYKVIGEQNRYLIQVVCMTITSIGLNLVLYNINKSMVAIATATLLTAFIWFLVCEAKDSKLRYNFREMSGIILYIVTYLTCGIAFSSIIGFLVYIACYILITVVLLNENLKRTISFLRTRKVVSEKK